MKKVSKLTFLLVAVIMVMQVVLPTISTAVLIDNPEGYDTSSVKLNIQSERPYSDDDGNGTKQSNDVYTFFANGANQTAFKIGDYTGSGLSFSNLYYCLKWGLGFGAGEISASGINYNYKTNLKNSDTGIANVSQIRWIADNMYVPNSEDSSLIKTRLLSRAGITNNKLTDDDIDVIQQFALWYFTQNSGDLLYNELHTTGFDLGKAFLKIGGENYSNDESSAFSKTRAEQMTKLFNYFINNASNEIESEPEITLSKEGATIIQTTLAGQEIIKIGPFKMDANNSNYFNFSYGLKYKENASGEWETLDTLNTSYYVLDNNHTTLTTGGENYNLKNEINNGEFYIAIIKNDEFANTPIANLTNFELNISYDYYNTLATVWEAGNEDQPVLKIEKVKENNSSSAQVAVQPEGMYDVILIKEDENGEELNSTATFKVNEETKQVTGHLIIADDVEINAENVGTADIYTIKETVPPDEYCEFDGIITVTVYKKLVGTSYEVDRIEYVVKDINGNDITNDVDNEKVYLKDGNIYVEVINYKEEKTFDLSLRKFITSTNGTKLEESNNRTPVIKLSGLRSGSRTTATYEHPKTPIYLKRGDIITYTIRVYNEGEVDGYAKEITDYLCDGLEFVEDSAINNAYGWVLGEDGKTIKTSYLENTLIKAYDKDMTEEEANRNNSVWQKASDGTDGLYYADVLIECKISNDADVNITLPNVAEISEDYNEQNIPDRDSTPKSLREDDIRNYENNPWYQDDDDYERVIIEPDKIFDLALRKYITEVNGEEVENTRTPVIDLSSLFSGITKTANYAHRKDPVEVNTGDIVTYSITVYNEGEAPGRATKIVDQLPTGLKFIEVVSGNYELESYNEETNTLVLKEKSSNTDLEAREIGRPLDSTTVKINCEVVATVEKDNQVLTNVAYISEEYNAETGETILAQEGLDRDSQPSSAPRKTADELKTKDVGYTGKEQYGLNDLFDMAKYFLGFQDDDDFEKIVIKPKEFDLSLRKYISGLERKGEEVEFDSREPNVYTQNLEDGTTANYTHPKNSLTVKQGDIITYTIRVYNEGELDGYAKEITDYLPYGLGFLNGYSKNENWLISSESVESIPLVGEDGWYTNKASVQSTLFADEDLEDIIIVTGKDKEDLKVTNNSLKNELIDKYDKENDTLSYKEVTITCIVLAPNTFEGKLVNIAEITKDQAIQIVNNEEIEVDVPDRDSVPNNVDLDNYELREENSTYQEDDDDYEPVELKYFDLALRKFITGVNSDEVTTRIPEFYIDENGNYKYKHSKEPVNVKDRDIVTYTIRIFNEGTITGFAEEIEDDIPDGLIFLPENSTNIEYRWKMYYYDEKNNLVETDDVEKAQIIRTDYLSEANGVIDAETGINSNLLKAFDKDNMEMPDFRDVKVAFKVSQKSMPEDKIIINKAQITEDSDDDEDSTPDEWNEGEDDQDIEKLYVLEFDLSLYKWVTETRVTVDGKTTTTETGFKPNIGKTEGSGDKYRDNDEQEPIASVVIDKKKIKSTVVKFVYNIKVVNEGDIEGYATEITDYIPEGLAFIAEDNPLWTIGEKDGTITTRALETILLKPGQSATIPVIFTWKNDANNLGLKRNFAAITEDYNEPGIEDLDSTPKNEDGKDNGKEQEDDDDYALVILTLKTGGEITYIGIIIGVISIIAVGALTIKKYVL